MRLRVCVVANSGDLPGHLCTGSPTRDLETITSYLHRDVQIRRRCANRGQLISEIAIQGFKPGGQHHPSLTTSIKKYGAVIDVHHVRAFHKGMRKIFVGRIERIVDLERPCAFSQCPGHIHVAVEHSGCGTRSGQADVSSLEDASDVRSCGYDALAVGTRLGTYNIKPLADVGSSSNSHSITTACIVENT